ncbi:homeobox protein vent1-like [Dysidea avara]|uniref:homeobox protein vent1-like n=1 Tax=Dysidea avara TaxID=196820 RepID=UPI00331BC32E
MVLIFEMSTERKSEKDDRTEEISRIMQLPVSAQGSSSSLADSDSSDRAGGKRHRTRFTPRQLSTMEAAFSAEKYPDMKARQELSEKLGLSEIQVQVWFQNKRAKARRKDKKRLEESSTIAIEPPSFWPKNIPFDTNIVDFYQEGKGASATTSSATPQSDVSQTSQEPHSKGKQAAPRKPLPPQYQVQYSQRSEEDERHEAWIYENPTNIQPHQLHVAGYSPHVQPAAIFQGPSYLQLGHSEEEDLYSLEPLVIPQLQPPLPTGQTGQSSSYAASSSTAMLPSLPPTYQEVSSLPQPGVPTTHHNPYDHPPY